MGFGRVFNQTDPVHTGLQINLYTQSANAFFQRPDDGLRLVCPRIDPAVAIMDRDACSLKKGNQIVLGKLPDPVKDASGRVSLFSSGKISLFRPG